MGRFSANVSCSHPQGAKGKVKERAIQESPIGDHTVFQRASPYLAARRGRRAPRGQRAKTGRGRISAPVEGRCRTCRRGQAPALRGEMPYLAARRVVAPHPIPPPSTKEGCGAMYDGSSVRAGSKPACPIGTTRPGGGEFSERSQRLRCIQRQRRKRDGGSP